MYNIYDLSCASTGRDDCAREVPAVNEQNALGLEGVPHRLHAGGEDSLARLKARNGPLAYARGSG